MKKVKQKIVEINQSLGAPFSGKKDAIKVMIHQLFNGESIAQAIGQGENSMPSSKGEKGIGVASSINNDHLAGVLRSF